MASLQQVLKPNLSPLSLSQPRSYFLKTIPKLQACKSCSLRLTCRAQNQNKGEEPPESLFTKELKRRGMTPTSLLEDYKQTNYGPEEEIYLNEEDRRFPNNVDSSLHDQRERSMALNSEALEGLVPRAKLLLTIGGTFFLGFWPLILITVAFFSTLYFYFGPTFIHDASKMHLSPPQYVDPYALLGDQKISQIAPPPN